MHTPRSAPATVPSTAAATDVAPDPTADTTLQGLTPAQRTIRARAAAYAMHAKHDRRQTTQKARTTFLARFERQVDPEGVLAPHERQRRAVSARQAYFYGLALRSSVVRANARTAGVK